MDQKLVDRLGHPEPPILAEQHPGCLNRVHIEPLLVEVEVGGCSAEEVTEMVVQVGIKAQDVRSRFVLQEEAAGRVAVVGRSGSARKELVDQEP